MINKAYLWIANGQSTKPGTLLILCSIVLIGVALVASSCVGDGNGSRF